MNKNMLIGIILFLLIIPINVAAKNEELTCNYKGTFEDENKYTHDIEIECKYYDNNTVSCTSSTIGSISLSNWGDKSILGGSYKVFNAKEYYSNNKSCFPYMVYVDDNQSAIGRYNLFAVDSYNTGNDIVTQFKLWESASSQIDWSNVKYTISIVELINNPDPNNPTEPSNPSDVMYKKIEEYINSLNDWDVKLADCIDENGRVKDFGIFGSDLKKACTNYIQLYYRDFTEWKQEVDSAIESGLIDENNPLVVIIKEKFENDKIVKSVEENFNIGELDCSGIFSGNFGKILKQILDIIKFAIPVIIIALSMVDFIKAIAAQNQDELKKAGNKLGKRIIIGILIFVLPTILEFILKLAGIEFGVCTLG